MLHHLSPTYHKATNRRSGPRKRHHSLHHSTPEHSFKYNSRTLSSSNISTKPYIVPIRHDLIFVTYTPRFCKATVRFGEQNIVALYRHSFEVADLLMGKNIVNAYDTKATMVTLDG
ncbi:hypothetical protein DM02DRAFT_227350 [Periconia macrospinosa]|uniref:Uncharacterized protein n=1 Tax=Periconia macrospinosa TaxID=97972 RepID=A0A2V1D8G2_9PLEO|nr:hypothetical protein DM02DRAFT_227350 [Periconia macrospinosa]